jgi:putative addiction module killer protein
LRVGNFGDVKPIGDKVSELRVDYGPGYRVYLTQRGRRIYLLLCGGDKRSQNSDIALARKMVEEL